MRFSQLITWKTVNKKQYPEPKAGLDNEFDSANNLVEKIKHKLEVHLKETQEKLNMPEIRYYTQSKFRYEFEIPDSLT